MFALCCSSNKRAHCISTYGVNRQHCHFMASYQSFSIFDADQVLHNVVSLQYFFGIPVVSGCEECTIAALSEQVICVDAHDNDSFCFLL